jgi:hypothetical protein
MPRLSGTQRPSVSLAVRQFKDAGLIDYSRGRLSIADRDGLMARACGCIRIMHEEERRLRETSARYDIAWDSGRSPQPQRG